MPRRVLILLAHPVLEQSRVNSRLIAAARQVPGVEVNDLYEEYPTLSIDVRREQALLEAHDVLVFQHPFYWYSAPAILKQWQDLVLEHGWAYGHGGDRLRGKLSLNAITTGGPADAYQPDGYNRFTIRQLLLPFEQTAHLCGLRFLAPFMVQGALGLGGEADVEPYAAAYVRLLTALRDDTLPLDAAETAAELNPLVTAKENPS